MKLYFFILGIVTIFLFMLFVKKRRTVGSLYITKGDEKDNYLFSIRDLEDLNKKKWVILRIINKNDE